MIEPYPNGPTYFAVGMGLFYFALRQSELLLLPPIQELEMRKKGRRERERGR